jgi:hypothetical protein
MMISSKYIPPCPHLKKKQNNSDLDLKVVGNEKLGGSRGWLLVEGDTGLWRSIVVYFLM